MERKAGLQRDGLGCVVILVVARWGLAARLGSKLPGRRAWAGARGGRA